MSRLFRRKPRIAFIKGVPPIETIKICSKCNNLWENIESSQLKVGQIAMQHTCIQAIEKELK